MSKAGQQIIDGLNDALAFAQGDESRAKIVRIVHDWSEWQPIETAPKDGTSVLLYVVQKPNAYTEAMEEPDGWKTFNVGFNRGDGWHHEWAGTPTHWMPLPAPPE